MRMNWFLSAAIAAAAALGFVGVRRAEVPAPEPLTNSPLSALASAPAPEPALPQAERIGGEVLETIPASKYTYLRLRGPSGELWAAVPAATIALHSQVEIANATRMDHFKSSTLKRTFDVVYFGTIAGGAVSEPGSASAATGDPGLPSGHPSIGAAPDEPSEDSDLPPGHPDIAAAGPFGAPSLPSTDAESSLPEAPSERAPGQSGRLIAELASEHERWVGQRVRVRGQVTKVTDLRGDAFFHIRDQSLGRDGHPVDLVVTSSARPKRGDIAVFEGILRTDVDVGIGYKYPLLIEGASRLDP